MIKKIKTYIGMIVSSFFLITQFLANNLAIIRNNSFPTSKAQNA